MGAKGVWLGNLAWPSNRSCGQFAEDCFRLSGATTDKAKALAFYSWFPRCMMRGPNLRKPDGAGAYSRCYDPLPTFTSWGHGECTFWGWVAVACLNGAGLKARRAVVHDQGHTYYELWYKGDDGVEQWHAFDPFGGWYFLNESGEVASCEQLAANPQLVQNPLPGHPVPLGHHADRANLAHRHRTADNLAVDQPLWDERNDWDLRRGMEVTVTFLPEEPSLALFARNSGGSHGSIAEISRLGFRQHAEHVPYWRNYTWPVSPAGQPVRWHGSGALRWKPLLHGAEAACDARNARFADGCLRPARQHDFTEVWYHFKLPYLISWVGVDYDVAGAGGDWFGLSLSADGRRSWWPMVTRSNGPHWGRALNGPAEFKARESSVQGLNEFWLRVDLASHRPDPTLAVQALDVAVGFQHNMYLQPRLLPGDNALWLEADGMDEGTKLQAEWVYQVVGDERRAELSLESPGRAERPVALDAACPSEVLMTGIKLNCL